LGGEIDRERKVKRKIESNVANDKNDKKGKEGKEKDRKQYG
jgi:hypothetical protein